MAIDPIRLARELIDVPSLTGEEAAFGERVIEILGSIGLDCRRHPVEGERFNVIAQASDEPRVLFCTHLDTVPPFFGSSEDDQWIRGRGACDAKGILAAMIGAADGLVGSGERRFGFLLLVGEETDSLGAKRANEEVGIDSSFVVVGEPTESKFVSACKGAVTARVGFPGKSAHSAYPERGDSAILRLAQAIMAIDAADWGRNEELGVATANVGVVRGGRKPNVVPDEAELELLVRSVDPHPAVEARIRDVVAAAGGSVIESYGGDPIFFHVPPGQESRVVAFGTDAPYLKKFGKRLLFGPGSILDAHGEDEKIAKADITSAVATYRELVPMLLA